MRRLIDFAISHSRSTFLILFGIFAFGIVARIAIPVENEPKVDVPFFVVTIPHEGISPEDATRLLIAPLEIELKAVEGIKEVSGTGAEHVAIVSVEFTASTDLDAALAHLREAVNRARQNFPSTTDEPAISEGTSHTTRILQVNLVS